MSKSKKRILIILGTVLLVSVLLGIISRTGNNPVANAVNTVFSPVQSLVTTVKNPFKRCFSYIADMKTFKSENERLKSELEILKKESRSAEEYKKENTRLKKILNLTEELEGVKTVPAKVIGFEPQNWFDSIIINKGTYHGIEKDDVVIVESGLVGKVAETGLNWSRVSTVFDSLNSIGVKITRSGDVGIVEGDVELAKKNMMKLGYISKETALINGDLIETSGLGGIYPPGILVGTVETTETDSAGELVNAMVKPAVNFSDIYEVVVMTEWSEKVYDTDKLLEEYRKDNDKKDSDEQGESEE